MRLGLTTIEAGGLPRILKPSFTYRVGAVLFKFC